ncbi:hypothetical protein RHECNPAF_49004 [Rhizobium etli CNPAF512]|nr:hypothetical protein RHECNPAF_49004 [Rhizobium etli CNPAF512]
MDGIDAVSAGDLADLGHQLAVGRQQLMDLLVFQIEAALGALGAADGRARNIGLLGMAVARRHRLHCEGRRRIYQGSGNQKACQKASHDPLSRPFIVLFAMRLTGPESWPNKAGAENKTGLH